MNFISGTGSERDSFDVKKTVANAMLVAGKDNCDIIFCVPVS